MGLKKIYWGLAALLFIILGSTFVYEAAGWSFLDSLYMVIITVFGVGFGEVHPLDARLKIFTILVIVAGASTVVYIFGSFVRLVTEGELKRMLGKMKQTRTIEELNDHAIICGYGRMGEFLARELTDSGYPFVIVDIDPGRIASAEAQGCLCIRGSALEEEVLNTAGIARAKVLATVLPEDTLNVFITLTARNLNRSIRIMARGEEPATEKKLRQAGADEVVLPASIGAMRIANSITRPSIMHFLGEPKGLVGHDLKYLGLEVDELTVQHDAAFRGVKLSDIQQKLKTAVIIIALKKSDGRVLRESFQDQTLDDGDSMIVLLRSSERTGLAERKEMTTKELL